MDRAAKLDAFIETDKYDELSDAHQAFLLLQTHGMGMYAQALRLRLELIEAGK